MSNETTSPTTASTTTTKTNLVVGQIVAGTVTKKFDYGCLVKIGDTGDVGLAHIGELAGGSHGNRKKRLAEIEVGKDIAVEVIAIKPPKAGEKRERIALSEKAIQDRAVRDSLVVASAEGAGTTVTGIVTKVYEYGRLVEIVDGPAKGFSALLHAREVVGASREARDAYIASLNVGDSITAEVLKVEEPKEAGQDLRIGLTQRAATERELNAKIVADGKVYKGTAVKNETGGMLVEFGPTGATMVGLLPANEVPSSVKPKSSVRVKIASIDGDTIVLTRHGIK